MSQPGMLRCQHAGQYLRSFGQVWHGRDMAMPHFSFPSQITSLAWMRGIVVREGGSVKDYSYAIEDNKAIHPAISPGPSLHAINRLSVQNIAAAVERLGKLGPRLLLFE
ncbi:hypothetical protein DPSP01_013583 [Paraphaeosphaeria sporulosa]